MTTTATPKHGKELIIPNLDWCLLRRLPDQEVKSRGGIILDALGKTRDQVEYLRADSVRRAFVDPAEPTKNDTIQTFRYEVLAVGDGEWTDYSDAQGSAVFLRRPMQTRVGDVVLVRAGAREVWCNDETLWLVQDHMCIARLRRETAGTLEEQYEPLHDFIFAQPLDIVARSAGGIVLPEDRDFTGNQRFGSERYVAMGTGEGAWALRHAKGQDPGYARRPLPVEQGDVFCAHGTGFGVTLRGMIFTVLMASQVAGVFRRESAVVQ